MKPEELRIGNYVFPLDQGGEQLNIAHKVTLITRTYVGVTFTTEINRAYSEIEGIPLTEEWLTRFGFKEVIEHYDGFSEHSYELTYREGCIDTFTVSYDAEDFSLALFESSDNHDEELGIVPNANKVRYVHQLQNLYYALAGEELTLNV